MNETTDGANARRALYSCTIDDPNAALGVAVRLFAADEKFNRQSFGHWANVLIAQIQRSHYRVVLEGNRVVGFLGWCLTEEVHADHWLAGGDLPFELSQSGNCIVINAWVSENECVNRFILDELRQIGRDQTWVCAKRHYADGSVRNVKLPVNRFVGAHVARSTQAAQTPRAEAA